MDDSDYRRPIINAFFLIGQQYLGNKMNYSLSSRFFLSLFIEKCNKSYHQKTRNPLIINSIKLNGENSALFHCKKACQTMSIILYSRRLSGESYKFQPITGIGICYEITQCIQ